MMIHSFFITIRKGEYNILPVNLHDLNSVNDAELIRDVCVCIYNGKWLYSKHKERQTWEIPVGHIEKKETIKFLQKELEKFTLENGIQEKQDYVFTIVPVHHLKDEEIFI